MNVLMIGGTGPSGIPIVRAARRARARRHDPAPGHARAAGDAGRGRAHPRRPVRRGRRCADALGRHDMGRRRRDVRTAPHGRGRVTVGRCGHFVSVGGVPAYRGWTNAWLHEPAGLPVPVAEDARARRRSRGRREGLPHRPHRAGGVRGAPEAPRTFATRTSTVRTSRRRASGRSSAASSTAGRRIVVADDGPDAAPPLLHRELRGRGRARGASIPSAARGRSSTSATRRCSRSARSSSCAPRARRRARDRVDALRARRPGVAAARAAARRRTGCST